MAKEFLSLRKAIFSKENSSRACIRAGLQEYFTPMETFMKEWLMMVNATDKEFISILMETSLMETGFRISELEMGHWSLCKEVSTLGDLLRIKLMDMDCTQILGEIDTNPKFMRTRKTRVTFSEENCMGREK